MVLNCNRLSNKLKKGINALAKYGFLTKGENGLEVNAILGEQIIIEKSVQSVKITYDTEPHFYMALARCVAMEEGVHVIEPKVKDFGFMLDCSRNAVAKPDEVKRLICLLVLLGYNYLELYTEDTFELPGEPYFGYKRGRYSAEELKDIVAFADIFEFEMVPCIQTLAHLRGLRNYRQYFDHMDIDDILLVDDERTSNLIRKMLKFCREVFHTKRINVGLDEAFHLGRGKYADIHGCRPVHEIYLAHMTEVFELCKEQGFEPEFWSDELDKIVESRDEAKELFDGTQTPICWKYSIMEKEKHMNFLTNLQKCAGKVIYACALWKWHGFAPCNEYSEQAMNSAFEAVEACGLDNILVTSWGDGGDECSVYATIPAMWYAAHKIYPCQTDANKLLYLLTGYTYDEWKQCDGIDLLIPNAENMLCTATKDLLFNDFLIGIMDYHIPDYASERYVELMKQFEPFAKRDARYSYIFEAYVALCSAVSSKATYSKRLYRAYQDKDHETIKDMIGELPHIREEIMKFHAAYRKAWLTENKGFGFEVTDVRIGSLIARIDTVSSVLTDYLEGKTDRIYELEDERRPYWGEELEGDARYAISHGDWPYSFTTNYVLHHCHTI